MAGSVHRHRKEKIQRKHTAMVRPLKTSRETKRCLGSLSVGFDTAISSEDEETISPSLGCECDNSGEEIQRSGARSPVSVTTVSDDIPHAVSAEVS